MGHNIVVSGHPKSIGIPLVDGFSMGSLDLRRHSHTLVPSMVSMDRVTLCCSDPFSL